MSTPPDDLRALIDAATATPARTQAAPTRPGGDTPSAELHTTLQQTHAEGAAQGETSPPRSALTPARLLAAALVLGLLLAAWVWHGMQPELSGPSATLRDLAQGVEQYRSQHSGSLPTQLNGLPQFPKTAVEWQLRYWKARDAAGRTEIMWAPNGSQHYRIVLRQGTAVWIYSDRDGLSKQTHP